MNYLAHLALSNRFEEILVGNMIEDFITGRIEHPRNAFIPSDILIGVVLHRHIDTFTDTNEIVNHSKQLFYNSVGKYASVVIDVYYDHFLIKNWSTFYAQPIHEFCKEVYDVLPRYESYYPLPLKKLIRSMVSYEWLTNYEFDWGLERALSSVDRQLARPGFLVGSMNDFKENYDELNQGFLEFYPALMAMSSEFLRENKLPK